MPDEDRRHYERWEVDAAHFQGAIREAVKNLSAAVEKQDKEIRDSVNDIYLRINDLDKLAAAHNQQWQENQSRMKELRDDTKEIQKGNNVLDKDVSNLKLMAAGIGALAGFLVSLIGLLIQLYVLYK